MCQSVGEITEEHLIVQELDDYIAYNGDDRNTLVMKVLRRNYISDIQIKQDLQPLIKKMKWFAPGWIALGGFFMFMAFYTFVEVVGYAEALMVFK